MNRYPLWKYAILGFALLIGLLYTTPNYFGEAPAVQVSSAKATLKIDSAMTERVQQLLQQAGLKPDFVQFDGNSVKARFGDTDTQLKAKARFDRVALELHEVGLEAGLLQQLLHAFGHRAVDLQRRLGAGDLHRRRLAKVVGRGVQKADQQRKAEDRVLPQGVAIHVNS